MQGALTEEMPQPSPLTLPWFASRSGHTRWVPLGWKAMVRTLPSPLSSASWGCSWAVLLLGQAQLQPVYRTSASLGGLWEGSSLAGVTHHQTRYLDWPIFNTSSKVVMTHFSPRLHFVPPSHRARVAMCLIPSNLIPHEIKPGQLRPCLCQGAASMQAAAAGGVSPFPSPLSRGDCLVSIKAKPRRGRRMGPFTRSLSFTFVSLEPGWTWVTLQHPAPLL